MTFDEFKQNVENWAAERGIYEHSTPEAQLLKAMSELGELADAVIKNDIESIKDGIGDVAVCMVNYARMEGTRFYLPRNAKDVQSDSDEALSRYGIAILAGEISKAIIGARACNVRRAMKSLLHIAGAYGLDFTACCEHAWNQIKDRRGRMVPGGAFVKEDA